MKKQLATIFALLAAVAAQAAAVIEQVIVRQQWPWSTDVKIEYKLSGVTTPVDIAVTAYDGEAPLDSSRLASALTGDRYGITKNGVGTIILDPVAAFGTANVALADFSVKLSLSDSAANINEVLYKIFDLTSGNCTDVTRKQLLNGEYGSVETDFSKIGDGFNTTLDDVLIWTGVTNNIAYKTTHLVMRKIPAKDIVWRCGDGSDSTRERIELQSQYYIKLREDFFIGVFELTQAQYRNIQGANPSTFSSADDSPIRPVETVPYHMFPGSPTDPHGNPGRFASDENVNWPTNTYLHDFGRDYVLDKFYLKTGWEFSLPTEAQWEFACRAGTTGPLYSGKLQTVANAKELGWSSTTSGEETATHPVGLLKPNAFGLYDMLGNVCEHTHNATSGSMKSGAAAGSGDGLSAESPIIDPVGATADAPNRFRRGNSWNYESGSTLDSRSGTRLYFWTWYTGRSDQGFRLVCPVTSQWAAHNL